MSLQSRIPTLVRSLLRGLTGALRQLALLLRLRRPAGCGFPRNLIRQVHRKDLSGSSGNAELRHLGAGPTRKASPAVTRARSGNSTNGDTTMYQNKVNLIGFLGNDAEVRT